MAHAPRLRLDDEEDFDSPSLHPRKASADADRPAEGVGPDLSKARQRKGKKLSDVWLVLKIRPDHLIAIEEGRFEALPGRVYAIGYVRSYAAYLGLDSEKFVDRLKAEMAVRGGPRDYALDFLLPAERKQPVASSSTVITSLALVALIYLGYQIFAPGERTFEQPVIPVPDRLAAVAGVTQKPVAEPPRVPVEQPIPIAPLPPVPAEITVTQPIAAPALPAPILQAPLPPGQRFGARNRTSRITLRVHRPTHVVIRGARNRVFIDRPLAPGDTYRVPNV